MATGGDDDEWQKLPCDEKVQHKTWKARMKGYKECVKLFRTQDSDKSPEFSKYLGLIKKFVIDPNENARQEALDAVFAFVEEAQVAGKTCGEVVPGLIGKCLNGRTKMKERAFDIILMYIEIEKQVDIEEELVKGLENKQTKIVQACLELLRKGLSEFGSKVLPIKPFLKQVILLLEDRDKSVRDEAKLLLVEVYKWIGKQTLTPMIQNVKPIQMQELQTEFDKLDLNGADKPRQTRLLRSQQDLKQTQASTTVSASVGAEDINVEMQEDLDPFEMMEAVNIIDRLPKDFFDKIESKQWKERKEVLDEQNGLLKLLTENPKPSPDADYFELIKGLKKIIEKDSNVPVVLVATKCLTALAKGLKKAFKKHAVGVLEVCLVRFREKKTNVIEALRETCEASYPSTNLDQLSGVAIVVLAHKAPIVRQCTQQFLTKCFAMATQTTLPKKVLKIYLPALVENTGEADPAVRYSAFESLGMLWKCIGEKHILPYITDLDELKFNKIKEYAKKAVLLNLRGEPRSTASSSTVTAAKKNPATTAKPAATKSEPAEEQRREPRPPKVRSDKPIDDPEWQKLPPDEKVQHKLWDARLVGYEECGKLFATQDSSKSGEFEDYLDLLPRFATDTNENAKEKGLDALLVFIQEAYVAQTTVGEIVPTLVNKCLSGRPKIKERAFDILFMYIQIEKNAEIEDELIKGLENKQPKIVQACLELFRRALSEFGSKVFSIKLFLPKVIPLLEDRDRNVRDEAKLLLVEISKWIGKRTLKLMLQNVRPIQMQELQTEFDKLDLNGADKPRQTRFLHSQQNTKQKQEQAVSSGGGATASVVADETEDEEAANIIDRLPKEFFEKIESKQWKDRKEVLDELLTLLTQNSKLAPDDDYFELIKALSKIISKDSNIPVVHVTVKCLTILAKGLGKAFKNHAVGVLEVCLDRFREKKPNLIEALREICEASQSSQ